MSSSRLDPNDRLLRRLKVTGPQLVYDPNRVQIFGQGRMLVEDYRPPTARDVARSASRPAEGLPRPQQTVFWWDTLLSFGQRDRSILQEGNVVMVHNSGQYVKAEGVLLPPWPELKTGRVITLRCQRLSGTFAEADASARAGGAADLGLEGGPRIGEPVLLWALGDVTMEEGVRKTRKAVGQHLEYRKRDERTGEVIERVTILGYQPGQPKAKAVLTFKDLDAGRQRPPTSSPSIIWFLNSDRIITDEVSAGG
jgi:hypothetical protein